MGEYWPVLFVAAVPILVVTRTFWKARTSRRPEEADPWDGQRKPVLFSDNPADITVRSADNYRLLSEAQLDAYEDDAS